MKRRALLTHLELCGCRIKREGKHTIYENPPTRNPLPYRDTPR